MTTEAKQLTEIVAHIIETRRDEIRISPSWVATEAMIELDADRSAPPLVFLGCHLELRQIARGLLRSHFEHPPIDESEPEFFPQLQWRYPTARSVGAEEPEYVLLEAMQKIDIDYNVTRLRREGMAKLRSADALEAYGLTRFRAA